MNIKKYISAFFLCTSVLSALAAIVVSARMSGMGQELHVLTIASSKIKQQNVQLISQVSTGGSLVTLHDEAVQGGYVDITHVIVMSSATNILAVAK